MNNTSSLSAFLNRPYPFYFEGKKLFEIASMIFLIGLFFNYLLQPFDVNPDEQKMSYFWICLIHSSTPIVVILVLAVVYRFFPRTTDDWKIKNEFVFVFFLVLFTGIGQFLLREVVYHNPLNWSWRYFKEELANTFIAGLFLMPIIFSINLNRQQIKNQQKANQISAAIVDLRELQPSSEVSIETEVKSERFTFDSNSFIYAKAEGNYADIYLKSEDKISKLTKRIALKKLETQLADFPFIIKTHRSVLLNLNYIDSVSGNAQGYKVTLKDCPEAVAVSRNYIQSFESKTALS